MDKTSLGAFTTRFIARVRLKFDALRRRGKIRNSLQAFLWPIGGKGKPLDLAKQPSTWPSLIERHIQQYGDEYEKELSDKHPIRISLYGSSLDAWQVHLWLGKLPIKPSETEITYLNPHQLLIQPTEIKAAVCRRRELRLAINFHLPALEDKELWLNSLRSQHIVWDPEPGRVQLLRNIGVNAYWLNPRAKDNRWLEPNPQWMQEMASQYGLAKPVPCDCLVLGAGDRIWEQALADWELNNKGFNIHYIPDLPIPSNQNTKQARMLAAWIYQAGQKAGRLAVLGTGNLGAVSALACLRGSDPKMFTLPITPAELERELAGQPEALAVDKPLPEISTLYGHDNGRTPTAAVVISLYNYETQICTALDSVANQTIDALELIVVDDASTDSGAEVARKWMLENAANRFCRAYLLCHVQNAGLATARNTAFGHSQAEWVYVLDADNLLFPDAVRATMEHTGNDDEKLAVIHNLVEKVGKRGGSDDPSVLISRMSWQRTMLARGNYIDAMALIRRKAWQAVGGYTHIEFGWEDYDFWCKLINAGFYGVLCPRILSRYTIHEMSMIHNYTTPNARALQRSLKKRHPWLNLPQGAES